MSEATARSFHRQRSGISIASCISVGEALPSEYYERHIIVGLDFTENSKAALEWAAKNIFRTGDMFHLIHVLPEPDTLHAWPGVYIPPDDAEEREEFKEATMVVRSQFAPICRDYGIPTEVHLIVAAANPDSVANILLDKVDDLRPAAVVVASHGKKRFQELWQGSVTKSLIRASTVPIVVCPP